MVGLAKDLDEIDVYVVEIVKYSLDLLDEEVARLLDMRAKLDTQEQFELIHGRFGWAHDFEFHEQAVEEIVKLNQIDADFRSKLLLDDVLGEDFTEALGFSVLLLLLFGASFALVVGPVEHLFDAEQEIERHLGQHLVV